jgi:hypothetical protein
LKISLATLLAALRLMSVTACAHRFVVTHCWHVAATPARSSRPHHATSASSRNGAHPDLINFSFGYVTAATQVVRKSFLHSSWSEMSLASELSGSEALVRVQSRVLAHWDTQWEKRVIATLMSVLYSKVANDSSDMVNDILAVPGI